jgi:hypothetical protein
MLFCLSFAGALGLYLGAGLYAGLQRRRAQAEQAPHRLVLHWGFWSALAGLVHDGVCFALGRAGAGADVQPVGGGGDFRRERKQPFSPP